MELLAVGEYGASAAAGVPIRVYATSVKRVDRWEDAEAVRSGRERRQCIWSRSHVTQYQVILGHLD